MPVIKFTDLITKLSFLFKSEYIFPHIGNKYIHLPKVNSTNEWAIELIKTSTPPHGTVVITDHQFAGKGQGNNSWISPPKLNITASIILFPTISPLYQYYLNKVTCIAILHTILDFVTTSPAIRWPNDIYMDNRKIAGILIQNGIMGKKWQYSVIGIGLNVNQTSFPNHPFATSLKMDSKRQFKLPDILDKLIHYLESGYQHMIKHDWQIINDTYTKFLYAKNQWKQFVRKDGKHFKGKIRTVDQFGRLEIENEIHQIEKFVHGQIKMISE